MSYRPGVVCKSDLRAKFVKLLLDYEMATEGSLIISKFTVHSMTRI